MNKQYVNYDKASGMIILNLSEENKIYEQELYKELYSIYAFETISVQTLKDINIFIIDWFNQKGINII